MKYMYIKKDLTIPHEPLPLNQRTYSPHLGDDTLEEIGSLVGTGTHQQAAIGAPLDGQPGRGRCVCVCVWVLTITSISHFRWLFGTNVTMVV